MTVDIAIVIPANIWFCPYVKIYTDLLDKWNISYCIIYWDKTASHEQGENIYAFTGSPGTNRLAKFWGYRRFGKFSIACIKKSGAKKVIVFSAQAGVFSSLFLRKYFKNNYIFDFRDLSIEQFRIFHNSFNRLLGNSYANVISSPGFLRCLPDKYSYVLSHNFIEEEVRKALAPSEIILGDSPVDILTIGAIRDFESNAPLMDAIGNRDNIRLRFIGKGPSDEALRQYAESKGYDNVSFLGYYKKSDEPEIVRSATFLNIYYPDWLSHATALSNRFYNSLIYRRPMIVTKGQVQGDFCEKYNLGIAISDPRELPERIEKWLAATDRQAYGLRCISLLESFLADHLKFTEMLRAFVEK